MGLQGPDQGAVLSLNAIGQQDTYLINSEPVHSLFDYHSEQHSNFVKFHKSITITKPFTASDSWPFGENVKVKFNPQNMGDLLSNMYIHIELPGIDSNSNIADQVGRHVIESISMCVDELEIDKYYDDWGIIYDELYLDTSEKRTKRYMINRNQGDNESHKNDHILSRHPSKLMIPIPLFFSRKYQGSEYTSNSPNRPFFPTCAIYKQKIEFDIKFRPQTFFTNHGTDSRTNISLSAFDIITEEHVLSPEERTYLMTKKQTFITDVVKKHPTEQTRLGENSIKLQLVPNIPVKTLNWFLRKIEYEDETSHGSISPLPDENANERKFSNRYNFSTSNTHTSDNSFHDTPLESAKIYVNGQDLPNIPRPDHNYFKYVVPYNTRLSRPERNIYTYAFSMNPINVEPSGSLDFSQLNSDRTLLDIQLKPNLTDVYTLHLYYLGYETFTFENGFMTRAY